MLGFVDKVPLVDAVPPPALASAPYDAPEAHNSAIAAKDAANLECPITSHSSKKVSAARPVPRAWKTMAPCQIAGNTARKRSHLCSTKNNFCARRRSRKFDFLNSLLRNHL